MRLLAWAALAVLLVPFAFPSLAVANAEGDINTIELKNSDYSFVDSQGMTNIVGIANNRGTWPLSVTMALNVTDSSGRTSTLYEDLYGSVIYPAKGAPFKFRLAEGLEPVGKPYVASAKQVDQPFYDTLVLNYTNMAVGQERVLTGTVKNIGNTELRNVYVYASVHDENTKNLDSVKSNVVPVLRPGEEAVFTASPDPAVKAEVYYYSCAGFDINAPIPTLSTGDGGFIAYDFNSIAKVGSLRYENATDSIAFDITHYNPKGGPASIKIPQLVQNQTVVVMMDGKPYDGATVKADGKTVHIDFFVPPGNHAVQIQGVRNMPEFPFAALGLAALTATVIAAARLKAAFKIS
ncbi:FxLYD domain-containing protein [Nitrososphaera viennensis]|nr:FxLYD domain-containing protein [Nitrososphaera viennensis]UVS69236.1 FxLYD domain-containing protein [Nitrososphaera viennensis]